MEGEVISHLIVAFGAFAGAEGAVDISPRGAFLFREIYSNFLLGKLHGLLVFGSDDALSFEPDGLAAIADHIREAVDVIHVQESCGVETVLQR